MPLISGRPPTGVVICGELGTISGTQASVKRSSDSPDGQAASDGAEGLADGTAKTAIAGAAAIATANPPARINRRAGSWKVAIVTLSVVLLTVSSGKLYAGCRRSAEDLLVPCRCSLPSCGWSGLLLPADYY